MIGVGGEDDVQYNNSATRRFISELQSHAQEMASARDEESLKEDWEEAMRQSAEETAHDYLQEKCKSNARELLCLSTRAHTRAGLYDQGFFAHAIDTHERDHDEMQMMISLEHGIEQESAGDVGVWHMYDVRVAEELLRAQDRETASYLLELACRRLGRERQILYRCPS